MVVPRVPGQEDQSAWQAGRPPRPAPGSSVRLGKLVEHRAGRLVPPGRLVEPRGPRSDDDSCRGGWSNPQTPCMEAEYSRARWSSPAALARTLSPTGQGCRPPRPAPGRSVPLGRLVEPRVQERPRSASVERRPFARHVPPRSAALGTSTCQPPQAFHHDRPWPSFGRSVSLRGRPRVLVYQRGRPHRLSSPAGATSGPEAWHRHTAPPARSRKPRRPAGSPARATWPNRFPRGFRRDERYTNGRQVAPDNRRQRQRDGAGSTGGQEDSPPGRSADPVPAHHVRLGAPGLHGATTAAVGGLGKKTVDSRAAAAR